MGMPGLRWLARNVSIAAWERTAAAWRFNSLVVLMAPVTGWMVARELVRETTGKILPGRINVPVFAWVLLPTVVLFGILRNVW